MRQRVAVYGGELAAGPLPDGGFAGPGAAAAERGGERIVTFWLEAAPPEDIDAGPVRLRRRRVEEAGLVARLSSDERSWTLPDAPD